MKDLDDDRDELSGSPEARTRAQAGQPGPASPDEFHALLAAAFESFPIGALIVGLDGRFLHVNPFFCGMVGRTAEDLLSHGITDFVSPHERQAMREIAASILDGHLDHYREERDFVRPDGSRVRLSMNGAVLRTTSGRPRAVMALASEVSERPSTEVAPDSLAYLERLTSSADPSDGAVLREEFDSFCRTVSQEFRVPLRIIEGYSEIVVEDFRTRLDQAALRYMHTIRDQSRRLSALVDNTLALAKIISHPLECERLDLSAMALEAAAVVRAESHAHDVQVRIEPGLFAHADPALTACLLKQLFENAFRFSRAAASPALDFGRMNTTEGPVFFVRDNGSGFDMGSAYKLFLPFETLHEGSEAAGAGVGLAEVKRIVSRHGGRVWAESSPGRGATFYFTLSPAEPVSPDPNV